MYPAFQGQSAEEEIVRNLQVKRQTVTQQQQHSGFGIHHPSYPYTQARRDDWPAWYAPDSVRSGNLRADIGVTTANTTSSSNANNSPISLSAGQSSSAAQQTVKVVGSSADNDEKRQEQELVQAAEEKPFGCGICGKKFSHQRHLKKHELVHTERSKSFTCKICDRHFLTNYHLKKHQISHLEEKIFSKKVSVAAAQQQGFIQSQSPPTQQTIVVPAGHQSLGNIKDLTVLQSHQQTLAIKEQMVNTLVSHQSNSIKELTKLGSNQPGQITLPVTVPTPQPTPQPGFHIIPGGIKNPEGSPVKGEKTMPCRICDKKFASKQGLMKHELSHLNTLKCQFCNKEFMDDTTLREHEKSHILNPYKCAICDKAYSRLQNLKEHEQTHLDPKPFKCNFCEKGFTTMRSHQRHEIKVHGETTYEKKQRIDPALAKFKCMYCDRGFSRSQNLKEHELTHTIEKPFQCSICHVGYTTKRSMKRHEDNHKMALGLI